MSTALLPDSLIGSMLLKHTAGQYRYSWYVYRLMQAAKGGGAAGGKLWKVP